MFTFPLRTRTLYILYIHHPSTPHDKIQTVMLYSSGSIHEFITHQCNGQVQQDISTTHYGIYNNIYLYSYMHFTISNDKDIVINQCLIHTEVHDLCIMLKVLDLLTSFLLT